MEQSGTFLHRDLVASNQKSSKDRQNLNLPAASARQSQKKFLKGWRSASPKINSRQERTTVPFSQKAEGAIVGSASQAAPLWLKIVLSDNPKDDTYRNSAAYLAL